MPWTEITRLDYRREGLRYVSDTTDAEWALIEPFMPARRRFGRPRKTELRAVMDAILYMRPVAASGASCRRTFRPIGSSPTFDARA